MTNPRRAYAFGLMTVLLWSTVATAFKLTLRHLEPVQMLLVAHVTSIVVLAVILWVRGNIKALGSMTKRQALTSLGLGLINPFLYYLVLFEAYHRLPAQEAQSLNYTWAITLSLLSVPLLKQRITARQLVAAALGYAGVVVIATRGDVLSLRFSDTTLVDLLDFQQTRHTRTGGGFIIKFFAGIALRGGGVSLVVYALDHECSGVVGGHLRGGVRDGRSFRALARSFARFGAYGARQSTNFSLSLSVARVHSSGPGRTDSAFHVCRAGLDFDGLDGAERRKSQPGGSGLSFRAICYGTKLMAHHLVRTGSGGDSRGTTIRIRDTRPSPSWR